MKLIVETGGINWNHYVEAEIDEEANTATVTKQYRLHKYDEQQGASEHPKSVSGDIITPRFRMSEWNEAGRPGGIDGLKENFSIPNPVSILHVGGHKYKVVWPAK